MLGQELLKLLKFYPAPLRAEIMILHLIEEELLLEERTFLKPVGLFKRDAQSSEIVDVEELSSVFGYLSRIEVSIAREGLYDTLPSGIFHSAESGPYIQDSKQVAESRRRYEEEEAAARGFFFPLDQEFLSLRIDLERQKKEIFTGLESEHLRRELWNFWLSSPPPAPDPRKESYFLSVLPGSGSKQRSLDEYAELLSGLLGVEVSIRKSPAPVELAPIDEVTALGSSRLGISTVLGRKMTDGLPRLSIKAGPVPLDQLDDYLEGQTTERWIRLFCDCFLPAGTGITIETEVEEKDHYFRLDSDPGVARLGYSSVLA